ncbi:MAG TPA: hypothetical protein VET48_09955 [Steroidobacteraceae bacterium]|nr:hypothetical protein [Steroidobacteraceae bacterium]
MLNKTVIALTAATVLVSASAAFAYEDLENRIGDRYPFLEQTYAPISAPKFVRANVTYRQTSGLSQFSNEAPENKIGDRYPFLEQSYQPSKSAGRYLADRFVTPRQVAANPYVSEAPENKIGDRYPFLEPRIAPLRAPVRHVMARRADATGSIR